ncbi:MAG: hypothetical protein K5852_03860 [Eubacterium sp.]|nr:hypothetical protein [Eubacterium sp.]
MKKEGKNIYTFLEPGDMPRANASILFSGLSLAILLITILAAFLMGGQGGLILGAVGLTGALFALYAFVIGMIALARRESRYRLCVVSAIVSGLMMIIWLTVFLNGLR